MSTNKILIVDSDNVFCYSLAKMLSTSGDVIEIAETAAEAFLKLETFNPDLAILDANLPDIDGLQLFTQLKIIDNRLPIILMSSDFHSDLAFKAFNLGVDDYIGKPFIYELVEQSIKKIFAKKRIKSNVSNCKPRLRKKHLPDQLVGNCPSMVDLFKTMNNCAQQDCKTILLLGESGTGKELVAHGIHDISARCSAPMIEVNCASIPENLMENELFGHEKGAYTDAGSREIGVFEQAEGGTVFLDEIGDMPLNMQAKVLKVIENRKFRRLGGSKEIEANIRIIAATNQDLAKMVKDKTFRRDLLYRLNMMTIVLKPLRDRKRCIPSMVEYFIDRLNNEYGRSVDGIAKEAVSALMDYDWPGNVRELRNAVERAMMLEQGKLLSIDHFCQETRASNNNSPATVTNCTVAKKVAVDLPVNGLIIEEVEKEYIKQALARYDGNQTKAAKCLGLTLDTLRYRRKKFELENYPPPHEQRVLASITEHRRYAQF